MTYEEKCQEAIKKLNSTLTKDSTKEQIDVVKGIEKDIEEMNNIHKKLNSDYEGVKTDYIELMKQSGNHKKSDDGESGGGNDKVDVDDVKSLDEDLGKYLKDKREKDKEEKGE